jgi:hypothetical protein
MKIWILLLLVFVILSGCTSTTTVYRNEVLVQDNYILTRANPFTDSTTSIRFYLKNYGMDTVPSTVVDFFDLKGLEVNNLICQGGSKANEHTCDFSDIESLDSRYVSLTVNTPSSDKIKSQTNFEISYKISFDYSGFRRLIIPVIDDMQETEPQNKYTISDSSVGPIAAEFEPPVGAETKQGDQTIKEYWGVKGDSFEVRMNFKQAVETNVVTNITGNNIKLKLQGLSIDSKSKCDFTSGLAAKFPISVGQTQSPLTCYFIATPFDKSETMTVIDANFAYTFETIKTETISVVPRQTEGGTNGEGGSGGNLV